MNRLVLLVTIILTGFLSFEVQGQVNGDFRTRQSGSWSDSDTWEEFQSGSWSNSANSPTRVDGVITILDSHSIIVTANLEIDQTTIQSNASVSVDPFVTLTIADGSGVDLMIQSSGSLILTDDFFFDGSILNVDGTIHNSGSLSLSDPNLSSINFNPSSVYQHNQNGGVLPFGTWDSTSSIIISGVTNTAPSNIAQTFGNFTWNSASQNATLILGITGTNTTIQGDLTVSATGGRVLALSTNTGVVLNTANTIISGSSRFALTSSGEVTLNTNNFTNTSTFVFLATSGTGIMNVSGNFIHTTGTLQGTGTSQLNFSGLSEQTYNASGGSYSTINFRLNSSAIVNSGTSNFRGTGSFTMNAGSRLILAETGGISLGTTAGAIRVNGSRVYGSGITFEYNSLVSTQFLGDDFPSSDVNLTINNEGGGVDMTESLEISAGRSLTLTQGTLSIGDGNTLTLNGTVSTTAGGISGGDLSDLVIGGTGAFGTLGFAGTNSLRNFTINRGSGGSVSLGGDLTVLGIFDQTAGDLSINGNILTLSGIYTRTAGTIIPNASSSLVIDGAGALPATLPITGTIQSITMNRTGGTFTTGSSAITVTDLNALSGTLDYTSGSFNVADGGTVERQASASFNTALTSPGSFDLTYNIDTDVISGGELPTNATALNSLNKEGIGILTLNSGVTINGDLTLSNGTFNAGAQAIDLKGNFVANAAAQVASSTFTFSGTTNLTGANPVTFGNIIVTNTFNPASSLNVNGDITNNGTLNSSAGTLTINAASQLGGSNLINVNNFTIGASGVVTASSTAALEIDGVFANNGSFDANGGTVIFGGNTSISGTVPDFHTIQIDGILNAPSTLVVAGDFTNNGTFNNNSGLLDMTGTGIRTIAGSSALSLYTLNVAGGTINNNNAAVSVANGITIGSSTTLDVDGSGSGNVILESSSATETAYVGIIPANSSITGNITVERYFNVGRYYRYLGSPITNGTVADWQEEFPITGTFSDPSTGSFDGTSLNSTNPSLFYYDAANSEYIAYPTSGTAASNPLENGRGYTPFLRNNTSNIIGAVKGTLKQQGATLPVVFSGVPAESWNLVANPYAAPIDWDAAGWAKVNVFDEIHVPISETGGYATYIAGVGSNGGSEYIASGQAFWVRTSASSPSITTVEGVKSVNQSPIYFRDNNPIETFRVKMRSPTFSDEVVFVLRDSATFDYDPKVDALRKLNTNGKYTFSTKSEDGLNLKINSIPKLSSADCSLTIPLTMESVTRTGDFSLSFEGVDIITSYYSVDLFDAFTGELIGLNRDNSYTFRVSSDPLSKAVERFSIILNNRMVSQLEELVALSTCEGSDASYTLNNLDPSMTYFVYKDEAKVTSIEGESSFTFIIADSLLSYEVSDFTIYGKVGACDSSVVGSFEAKLLRSVNLETEVFGSEICSGDVGTVSIDSENDVIYHLILDGFDVAEVIGTGDQLLIEIPQEYLMMGTNQLFISAATESCGEFELNASAVINVSDLQKPEITASSNMLQSSIEGDFYQWILNGKVLDGEKNATLLAKVEGSYEVKVTKAGCEKISDAYLYSEQITSNEKSLKEQFKLYPNPILDYMNIESNFTNLELDILTLEGKVVETIKTDEANAKVNMSNIKPGVYYLRVNVPDKGFTTFTIIKR